MDALRKYDDDFEESVSHVRKEEKPHIVKGGLKGV